MKKILFKVLNSKILSILKEISGGVHEIIIDINLGYIEVNSIEYFDDTILLHVFKDDYDYVFYFYDLQEEDMLKLYKELKFCLRYL